MAEALDLYAVYFDTSDFPGKWVTRRHVVAGGKTTPDLFGTVCDSLARAREAVPPGRFLVPRDYHDDPVIVEVWL